MSKAYLLGVLHDATERKITYRISQKDEDYIKRLMKMIQGMGANAWMYQEGKDRDVYVVEFSKSSVNLDEVKLNTRQRIIDYVRGYFDAEGGIAKDPSVKFYIYFAQKDREDLEQVKHFLTFLGVKCGKIHNPSKRVDPDYFRFYVATGSHKDFANIIGSWHPVKNEILRMKI